MFKKLLKNLSGNLEEKAKEMMNAGTGNAAGNEHIKAYATGDMQKAFEIGAASAGVKTASTAKEDPNDPNMQPVHGITIFDYAAGAAKRGEGCSVEQVCAALGVEKPMWDEAETIWNSRMRDDSSFNVVGVYSNYFGKVKEHEKLGALKPDRAPASDVPEGKAAEHLARLESDKHYFFEIQAAMEAAYANGIDGAQWLVDNIGLTVSQVTGAGARYMNDFNIMAEMMDYQEEKKKEYNARFAKENGSPGVVDDIEF